MGRLFWLTVVSLLLTAVTLFFPIFIEADAHYDMNREKFGFALYAYKIFRLIGGYATVYPGGVALHVSPKKAILKPYSGMDDDRKRFSFVKTFRVISFALTIETGAEYVLPVAFAHTVLRMLFFTRGGAKDKISNRLWMTDGDELKVSLNFVVFFNLFILLRAFMKFLKEKIKNLWQRKTKKSTI